VAMSVVRHVHEAEAVSAYTMIVKILPFMRPRKTGPPFFPRVVQHAIWAFCATGQQNICNGTQINDRDRCRQATCPVFPVCDRLALR
jgi:hypothetical protein